MLMPKKMSGEIASRISIGVHILIIFDILNEVIIQFGRKVLIKFR